MRSFRDLTEAKGLVVMSFSRMNPPTIGHLKLADKQKSIAGSKPSRIYLSQTTGPKDPLPFPKKVAYVKQSFGSKHAKSIMADKSVKTFIQAATKLNEEGYTQLIMVAGSDRIQEFQRLLDTYNGKPDKKGNIVFDFPDGVKVVSSGERDPDSADPTEAISASVMRKAAQDGDFDIFKKGSPLKEPDAKKMYLDVRKFMGVREEREMGDDYDSLRDAYLTGKIWNVGESVETEHGTGEVVRKGTNYISYMIEGGKVYKSWLTDIAERNYKKEYANYQGTPEQIARRSSRNKARRAMGDKAVKGMDVGHRDNNPMNNDPKNLRNEDPSVNRREPRLREVKAPDVKKGDVIIVSKSKRPYKMGGMVDPKTTLPAESDKMVVKKVTKSKDGRKAHLTHHDPKKRGGYAIYLDKMPDFMSVKIAENLDEAFPVQVTVKDKKGKTHTTGTRDLRGATHALLIHYKEIPPVKGNLPGSKETKPAKTEIFLGTEGELAKTAKRMLKQHPSKKYATGAEVVKLDQKMVKGATLSESNEWGELTEKAEYDGRPVDLNNPTEGDTKKYKVYVRNDKGNVVKVEFGDPNMEIKRDSPGRLKAFRARHQCDTNPGPKWKARYWSCKFWEKGKTVTDLMKG